MTKSKFIDIVILVLALHAFFEMLCKIFSGENLIISLFLAIVYGGISYVVGQDVIKGWHEQ